MVPDARELCCKLGDETMALKLRSGFIRRPHVIAFGRVQRERLKG